MQCPAPRSAGGCNRVPVRGPEKRGFGSRHASWRLTPHFARRFRETQTGHVGRKRLIHRSLVGLEFEHVAIAQAGDKPARTQLLAAVLEEHGTIGRVTRGELCPDE